MIVLLVGPRGGTSQLRPLRHPDHLDRRDVPVGMQSRTDLGRLACSILSGGGLVEDEIVNAILARRISLPEFSTGFLLDGYPRTLPQAQFLDRILKQRGSHPLVPVHLDVPFPRDRESDHFAAAVPALLAHLQPALSAARRFRRLRCRRHGAHHA